MKQYFMDLQCYTPKNKAHEAAQEFIRQFNHCLIDEDKLNDFRINARLKVAEINGQLPPLQVTDKEYKNLMKALYPKDKSKNFRR